MKPTKFKITLTHGKKVEFVLAGDYVDGIGEIKSGQIISLDSVSGKLKCKPYYIRRSVLGDVVYCIEVPSE